MEHDRGLVAQATARVVVLAGPSGAGKSRLAARLSGAHGWPIVRLDDFYRDEDDPQMPRSAELGIIDWDHPDSWNRAAALEALSLLVAFIPALHAVSPFAWFIGAGLGAAIQFVVADRTARFEDVSGEPIAVECVH